MVEQRGLRLVDIRDFRDHGAANLAKFSFSAQAEVPLALPTHNRASRSRGNDEKE
jgi:hypothetical protein